MGSARHYPKGYPDPEHASALRRAEHTLQRVSTGRVAPHLPRYRSGTRSASATVVTMPVMPTSASRGVHDFRVSTSVTPPIFENSQNPLSFIHVPTSDPLAIAVATYTV